MRAIAFLGGTGPQGLGLALRLAAAGQPVVIGSRVAARAAAVAEAIRTRVPGADARGGENLEAIDLADRVALTFPSPPWDRFSRGPPRACPASS